METENRKKKSFNSSARQLTAKDVCSIIEKASDAGVVTLRFGDLHLSWSLSDEFQARRSAATHTASTPEAPRNPYRDITGGQELEEDVRHAQQLIDDPAAYEQDIIDSLLNGSQGNNEEARHRGVERAVPGG